MSAAVLSARALRTAFLTLGLAACAVVALATGRDVRFNGGRSTMPANARSRCWRPASARCRPGSTGMTRAAGPPGPGAARWWCSSRGAPARRPAAA